MSRRHYKKASNSKDNGQWTFSELLDAKRDFLSRLFGEEEYERIRSGPCEEDVSFDINPRFQSRSEIRDYWIAIRERFLRNDPQLNVFQSKTETRAEYFARKFFDKSCPEGLGVLIVGCYHVRLFDRNDVVCAAKAFLESTSADRYMLITASCEEVMVRSTEDKGWKNGFLELITDDKYSDRVFPLKLRERPEFHFSGRCYRDPRNENEADWDYEVGFETHHGEHRDPRLRVSSKARENLCLALRSFARYVGMPENRHACSIERHLDSYKKYSPEFFYLYRSLPPYMRDNVKIDFSVPSKMDCERKRC